MFGLKNLRQGLPLALSATIFGSFVTVIVRYVLKAGENPLNITAWLILFMVIPWLFVLGKHTKEFKRLSIKNISLVVFIGIASSLGVNYLQSLALAHTSAVNFAFLYRTVVVFTIIFAWLFLKEKLTWGKGLVVMLIVLGTYLITSNGTGFVFTRGDMYAILMAASAAFISNILVKHSISKMHPDLSGSIVSLVACSCLVTFASVTHVFQIPQHVFLVFLASIFYFALIFLRNRAYSVATASFVTMVFALTPLFVTILSLVFLHEIVSPVALFGGFIIVGATFIAERYKM